MTSIGLRSELRTAFAERFIPLGSSPQHLPGQSCITSTLSLLHDTITATTPCPDPGLLGPWQRGHPRKQCLLGLGVPIPTHILKSYLCDCQSVYQLRATESTQVWLIITRRAVMATARKMLPPQGLILGWEWGVNCADQTLHL